MDSLKTLDSQLIKQSAKSQFQGESGNKEQWLRALEKNSLYSSLEKFEVIEGQQRFKVTVNKGNVAHQKERLGSDKKNSKIKQSMISLKPTVIENSVAKANQIVSYNRRVVNNGNLNQAATNYQQIVNLITTTHNEGLRLAGLYKGYEMKMPWLSKNTTITVANSGLELWVRDAGITGNKLREVLKHLQYTMADLGASLAKVTVNGKVIFYQKNHGSSMEG